MFSVQCLTIRLRTLYKFITKCYLQFLNTQHNMQKFMTTERTMMPRYSNVEEMAVLLVSSSPYGRDRKLALCMNIWMIKMNFEE